MSDEFERVRVRVNKDYTYDDPGKLGWQVGPKICTGPGWIPVLWDDDDDEPTFFKESGLDFLEDGQEQYELRQNIFNTVIDLVSKFTYDDREEDETLSPERLAQAFADGVITHEEVADHFLKELKARK